MEKYIKENLDEFPAIYKEIARCEGYMVWFDKGKDMLDGKVKNCQPAIYQMIMRNMWDWDKVKNEEAETTESLVRILAKKWREENE